MRSSVKFEVLNAEQRRVRNAGAADVLLASLSAVEHDDDVDDVRARVAKDLRRPQRIATCRDHVLDDSDSVVWCEMGLALFRRPVYLRFLAHQYQRKACLHGDGASDQDRA